tara:strand:+ start:21469 stop:21987 length:519 start_codon:yes stop_codon:yes gene_type:complete
MKNVVLVSIIPFIINNGSVVTSNDILPIEPKPSNIIKEPKPSNVIKEPIVLVPKPLDDLIEALIQVESMDNDSAVGDTHLPEPSIGVLQIRPIMVREVNRICKIMNSNQQFTLKDRFDRGKSIHMFMVWKEFHHKDSNFEKISRSWNGGPRGPKSNRTLRYWGEVEEQLNIN